MKKETGKMMEVTTEKSPVKEATDEMGMSVCIVFM